MKLESGTQAVHARTTGSWVTVSPRTPTPALPQGRELLLATPQPSRHGAAGGWWAGFAGVREVGERETGFSRVGPNEPLAHTPVPTSCFSCIPGRDNRRVPRSGVHTARHPVIPLPPTGPPTTGHKLRATGYWLVLLRCFMTLSCSHAPRTVHRRESTSTSYLPKRKAPGSCPGAGASGRGGKARIRQAGLQLEGVNSLERR